jgi:putative sensory transduction regulator
VTVTNVADIVERYLAERDLRYERVSEGDWAVLLNGEKKLSITVLVALRERTIAFESFFIRRPAENHAELYRMLLRANARVYGVRFALDDLGDVYLVGRLTVEAVTEEELDRIFGSILQTTDGMFMPAIEVGFASYLARDLAWRAAQGKPEGQARGSIVHR